MIKKSKVFSEKTLTTFLRNDLTKIIMHSTELTKEQAEKIATETVAKCQ
jgi:hypothetical protein